MIRAFIPLSFQGIAEVIRSICNFRQPCTSKTDCRSEANKALHFGVTFLVSFSDLVSFSVTLHLENSLSCVKRG